MNAHSKGPCTARLHTLAAVVGSAAFLAACGGGGGGDTVTGTSTTPTTAVRTTVIDGPLRNATVCLDKNANGTCDAGEPSARTAADGTATLDVDDADVGKFGLVAMVGTDAVDATSGPVTVAYTLRAPAESTGVVSPLTTLLARQMAQTGGGVDVADQSLRVLADLDRPFGADYTQGTDSASARAAALAQLVVAILQQPDTQTFLASIVGRPDANGTAMTRLDAENVLASVLVQMLPTIAVEASKVAAAADATSRAAATTAALATIDASSPALDATSAGVLVAASKSPDVGATGQGGLSTTWFSYTDAANWFMRYFSSTPAQDTPDASGMLRYVDNRKQSVAGAVQVWGASESFTRTDLFFDGSTWFLCPTDFENQASVRDAAGRSESLYCTTYASRNVRSASDISGQRMADVIARIRAYPLASTQGSYPSWGPDPTLVGSTTFPTGSKLFFQTSTPLSRPDAYNPATSNRVTGYSSAIAAGGDTRTNAALACNGNAAAINATQHELASLDELVGLNTGTPCLYAGNTSTGSRNEWGSNSTAAIGTVAAAQPSNTFYRAARTIRVSFDGGADRATTYWSCAVRASDGSSRNCDKIGTGTYTITTAGDGRTLKLAGVPSDASSLTYDRVFVERGGKVYWGYRDKLRVDNTVRLNQPAFDAMLSRLGIVR